jgi:hypothetical protein
MDPTGNGSQRTPADDTVAGCCCRGRGGRVDTARGCRLAWVVLATERGDE